MKNRLTFKHHAIALAVVSAWCLFMAFSYSTSYYESNLHRGREVSFFKELMPYLISCCSWVPLTPLMLMISHRFAFLGNRWALTAVIHLAAGMIFGSFKSILTYWLYEYFSFGYNIPMWGFSQALFGCINYGTFLAFYNCILFYQRYKSRKMMAVQLESQLARAQLQVLKMQLHPHFLFNTLHNIASLNLHDVKAANRMISRLSDLLRLSLENIEHQEVSLKEEVDFLNLYLDIEKIRFSDRLVINQEIEQEVLDARVPNLILQPIVENAIQHGISRTDTIGEILIRATRQDDKLHIEITDNGPGLQKRHAANSSGVGLKNTVARIQQIYGSGGDFELATRDEGGCVARLVLPFRMVSENDKGSSR